ncbi:MAG TPA: type II toxin-antitoxin system VapC family toxin [Anaerolineae bacterium]|nr:type II toxin-antitoxin system VapC family toxin [Anaerolineae bacterium]
MSGAVVDTHALVWYLEDSPRLGPAARQVFDACDHGEIAIYVPTICLVEVIYLQEKGRIPAELKAELVAQLQSGASGLIMVGLTPEVAEAVADVPREAVPDMPDRIIAATARHLGLPLVSRDRMIHLSGIETIW